MASTELAVINEGSPALTIHCDLTEEERQRLFGLENIVNHLEEAAFRAGLALQMIRDEELYRHRSMTWRRYLKEQWDITPSQASRLMIASNVSQYLESHNEPIPLTVSQCNELYQYRQPPERIIELWQISRDGNETQPNWRQIRAVAKRLYQPPPTDPLEELPDEIYSVFKEGFIPKMGKQLKVLSKRLANAGPRLVPWLKGRDPDFDAHLQMIHMLEACGEMLESVVPHSECPTCEAKMPDCMSCRGTGWVPEKEFMELTDV